MSQVFYGRSHIKLSLLVLGIIPKIHSLAIS